MTPFCITLFCLANSGMDSQKISKEMGVWLNALPVTSCSLHMDDRTIRVAVGLRVSTPLCLPHQCHHCSGEVDCLGTHCLSCWWSEGHFTCHAALNDIIYPSLH